MMILPDKKNFIILTLLLFAVSFGIYTQSFSNNFIWDDEYLIINNPQIKSIGNILSTFTHPIGWGSENLNNFYRPIQEISNMVDYRVYGLNPRGYHITNTILHSIVTVSVFLLLFAITGDKIISFLAALFYSIHPVHTEAVAYIAGRADMLSTIFLLFSFILFVKHLKTRSKTGFLLISSVFCFILALLSKETAIVLPLLVYVYLKVVLKQTTPESYKIHSSKWKPYMAVTLLYCLSRMSFLDFSVLSQKNPYLDINVFIRFNTFIKMIPQYLETLLLPLSLHMEHHIVPAKTLSIQLAVEAILILIILTVIAISLIKKKNHIGTFFFLWMGIFLLPYSNLFPVNAFFSEHWLYAASIGFFYFFGVAAKKIYYYALEKKRAFSLAIVLIISLLFFFYAFLSSKAIKIWQNEITFFKHTLKYNPDNIRLHLNLGNSYMEKGIFGEAINEYNKCIKLDPGYLSAYMNLGSLYIRVREDDLAKEYLQEAIKINNKAAIAYFNLGLIYYNHKKLELAEKNLLKTTEILPQFYQGWNLLGNIYLAQNRKEEADKCFQKSLAILPSQGK